MIDDFDFNSSKKEILADERNSVNGFNTNSLKLKKFVKHLSLSAKKLEELNGARKDLQFKLDEMKNLKQKKASEFREGIDNHVEDLMKKLDYLVDLEKQVLKKTNAPTGSLINENQKVELLQKEIEKLRQENSKMDLLVKTISELKDKLDSQENKKLEREKRMEELEEKIQEKVSKNIDEIIQIENSLDLMHKQYDELLKTGKHSEEDLAHIKEKIDNLKNLLELKK